MEPAVAAVIGAGIGASATLVGSVLGARQQGAQQRAAAARERKEAAYGNAIRSLLRARNRRSSISIESGRMMTILSKEDIGTFFDDLIDAQYGLAILTTVCGSEQREPLVRLSNELDSTIGNL